MGRTEGIFRDAGIEGKRQVASAPSHAAPGKVSIPAPRPALRHVLHIAGRVSEAVFSFLGPTLQALDRAGVQQTLVLLDWPDCRFAIERLPPGVTLVAVPVQRSMWRNWLALSRSVDKQFENLAANIGAVHIHGLLPYLLGGRMGRPFPNEVTTYFTPHGSRLIQLLRGLRDPLIRKMGKRQALRVIVNSPSDASLLRSASIKPVLVESSVDGDYFRAERQPSTKPLVVSGSALEDRSAVEMFSRLAVVLGAAELGLRFDWLGGAGADGRAQLKAAGVDTFDGVSNAELAQRMASAWLFIAAEGAREFPVMLACAMAAGLPCLAAETANHRDLIRHGETGFIYGSEAEALQLLTMLLDDHALREKLSLAARADATSRFRVERLDDAIRRAYNT